MRNREDRSLTQTGTTRKYCPDSTARVRKRVANQKARTVNVRKRLHRGTVEAFVFYCYEPPDLWGEDEHPRPLDYLLAWDGS